MQVKEQITVNHTRFNRAKIHGENYKTGKSQEKSAFSLFFPVHLAIDPCFCACVWKNRNLPARDPSGQALWAPEPDWLMARLHP